MYRLDFCGNNLEEIAISLWNQSKLSELQVRKVMDAISRQVGEDFAPAVAGSASLL